MQAGWNQSLAGLFCFFGGAVIHEWMAAGFYVGWLRLPSLKEYIAEVRNDAFRNYSACWHFLLPPLRPRWAFPSNHNGHFSTIRIGKVFWYSCPIRLREPVLGHPNSLHRQIECLATRFGL